MQYVSRDGARSEGEKKMTIDDLSNSELSDCIDEWVRGERDRAILKRRLIDRVCYEPLAEEFDLSVQRIKAIAYKAQDRLFRHIK